MRGCWQQNPVIDNGAHYGEILRQLDALQANPETVEFGKVVEAEVRSQLGHNAAKLDTASYRTGNNVFSRNGQTPDQMRAAAEVDAKRPAAQRTGAYDRYMAEDKAHGDGKFATDDSARINDGWRSMIASGAKTPAEFTGLARTADGQLNASIAAAQTQFSTVGFQALGADKLASGFLNSLTQAERLEGKDWAQDVGLLLRKGPEVVAAFQWGVTKGAAGAAWDMVTGIASLAGKAVQMSGDTVAFGGLGKLGDAARDATPDWVKDAANSVGAGVVFDAMTPSYTRGKAISAITDKAVTYFQTHSAEQIGQHALNALDAKWESIKGEFHALNGDPVKQADWLGQQVGAVAFEVASTVVPVTKLGTAARVADKAGDAARVLEHVDDVPRVAEKATSKLDDLATLVDETRPRGGFDDLLKAGRLSADDLTLLARAGKLSASEISDVVMHLGVKTPRDQLVLWSGLGETGVERAAQYAAQNGGMTLEMTKGGNWLNDLKLFEGRAPNIDDKQAYAIWEKASKAVADQAEGQVRVAAGQVSPSSVYSRIERPALLNNPNVLGIDIVQLKPKFDVR